eukprot:TRINITY_DN660_c0_g3_i2.p1 TRINITY_DN660_c0_g3~~TRINITY_DN660_c0_g3_i2.p1  ORF type:complete len:295 (+),score=67.10 TRINITY_DN660_c0_g3_i2:48-887(+)
MAAAALLQQAGAVTGAEAGAPGRAAGAVTGAEAGPAVAKGGGGLLLFVRQAGGELRPVEVEPMAAVADVLTALGNPRMVLAYQGQRLDPRTLLADAGVCSQAVLEAGREPVRVESVPDYATCGHAYSGLVFGLQAKSGSVTVTTLGVSLHVSNARNKTVRFQVYRAKDGVHVPIHRDLDAAQWELCAEVEHTLEEERVAGHLPPVPVELNPHVEVSADSIQHFYIFVEDQKVSFAQKPEGARTVDNDEVFSVGRFYMERQRWQAAQAGFYHFVGYVEYV